MSNLNKKLTGVCPILPTPFDEENHVDVESLKRVVRFMLDCKVTGIALFGNASEAFALTQPEKELIAKVVVEEVDGRVPLVFGAGGTSTETAICSCQWAESAGADILMIMPPYMIKPDGARVYEYYAGIAENVHTPIMIQDAPGASGVAIDVNTVVRLAEKYNLIQYVKAEAPPTFPKAKAYVDAAQGKFAVFGGMNAAFFYEELCAGVVGTMPAGEFPEVCVEVFDLYMAGKKKEAKEVFYKYLPFIRMGNIPGNIAMSVHKEVLKLGGIFSTAKVRSPYLPASDYLRGLVYECVEDMDLRALSWMKDQ